MRAVEHEDSQQDSADKRSAVSAERQTLRKTRQLRAPATRGEVEPNAGANRQEEARLAALTATGILDTEPETSFDAITRLAAEHFKADTVLLGFADQSRIWIKSHWGEPVRELPRQGSIFELVLAEDGPVVVADIDAVPYFNERRLPLRRISARSFACAPVRSQSGHVLGTLTVFSCEPRRPMPASELKMLESLAEMAASQLELRRLRNIYKSNRMRQVEIATSAATIWPRRSDLREALDRRQFVLHYQPEIELTSRRIIGMEALIRWQHPERGLIPPMNFIPTAEETGMILPIGDWGMAEVCRQIRAWCAEDSEHSSLRICVNLSARQFAREGLADHVEALLRRTGISSRQLGLEMTETSLIPEKSAAIEVLGSLRRLGVTLLMDDFGTGYSSLHHLHSFPFDVLKIDRSFVTRMTEGAQPLQIVRTIVELARVLGMDVVAEGIETREQDALLQQLGCRYGQGFLYSRPVPAEEISKMIQLPGRVLPESAFLDTAARRAG
jgi:EAL domain-containing protein (putative c-di-GMP-specific phosphodiesterase class I)